MGENHSFWLLKRFLIFQGISWDLDVNVLKHITMKIMLQIKNQIKNTTSSKEIFFCFNYFFFFRDWTPFQWQRRRATQSLWRRFVFLSYHFFLSFCNFNFLLRWRRRACRSRARRWTRCTRRCWRSRGCRRRGRSTRSCTRRPRSRFLEEETPNNKEALTWGSLIYLSQ